MRFRNEKRSGTVNARCLRSRNKFRSVSEPRPRYGRFETFAVAGANASDLSEQAATPSGQRKLSDEPEPLYPQFSLEVARGRKGAGGEASTPDAGSVSGNRYHRPDPLLALYAFERKNLAVSRRFRRRIRSTHGRSRQARGTGVRRDLPACGQS